MKLVVFMSVITVLYIDHLFKYSLIYMKLSEYLKECILLFKYRDKLYPSPDRVNVYTFSLVATVKTLTSDSRRLEFFEVFVYFYYLHLNDEQISYFLFSLVSYSFKFTLDQSIY